MKEKKEANVWFIGAINYLVGGLLWPLVLSLLIDPLLGIYTIGFALGGQVFIYSATVILLRIILKRFHD